ncbi:MAG: CDF family Co(II)/Ni(II) efflux transporter DmeF [Phenylobacterium sp.]
MTPDALRHDHVFLGEAHERNERRVWFVIVLCGAMMLLEIVGGAMFGSIALVADGLHMSTHAGALLLAALAYTFARRYASDPRFSFGTGKLGDLAGFSSAIVLAMIALLIGYEAVSRVFSPVPIHFREAIPIAILGLGVNLVSAWLLGAGGHDHGHHHGPGHSHGHSHDHGEDHAHDDGHDLPFGDGFLRLEVFEDGVPPVFRLHPRGAGLPNDATVETVRADGARQTFVLTRRGDFLESLDEIPEPHAFTAEVRLPAAGAPQQTRSVRFEEHGHAGHGAHHRDNNMRAAMVHVMADAAVSVLVIVGLILARSFGWLWMDPLAGIVGALVIASWSFGLIRDTGAILLDMNPDRRLGQKMRDVIEAGGDQVADLHLWRLGPGHLGAIVTVATDRARSCDYYRNRLAGFTSLSHLTVEVTAA